MPTSQSISVIEGSLFQVDLTLREAVVTLKRLIMLDY